MVISSYIPAVITTNFLCLFSNYFGKIYISTLMYFQNFFGTLFYIKFMHPKVASTYGNVLLMVNLEALLREGRTTFWRTLRDSKLMQTIVYMGCSAIVLDTLSKMPSNIFWFINPRIKEKKENPKHPKFVKSPIMDCISSNFNNCEHTSSCDWYIFEGSMKMFLALLGIESARVILTSYKSIFTHSTRPSQLIRIFINRMNLRFVAMVSSYTAIFKTLQCLQNRLQETPSAYANLISGFLSGSVYWINADWSILCHGLSAAIQLAFQNYFLKWLKPKNKSMAHYVANFPWAKAFYTMTIGYAFHLSILYPSLCSKLLIRISDMASGYRFKEYRRNTLEALCATAIKTFVENVTEKRLLCSQIYHPGESCLEASLFVLKKSWKCCAIFHGPIFLLALVKHRTNWKELKNSFRHYVNMVLASYIPAVVTTNFSCLFSNYFGKIYISTLMYFQNFVGTLFFIKFMQPKVASTYANVLLMVNLEALLREGRTTFWRTLRDSKLMQTIVYMGCSAIVLDTLSKMPSNIFWFINPRIKEKKENPKHPKFVKSPIMDCISSNFNNCEHTSSCDWYIFEGSMKMFLALLGIESARVILTSYKSIFTHSTRPSQLLRIFINRMNPRFMAMVSSYTAIFKTLQCLQNRLQETPSAYANLISGFLSGSVYWINADWSILCHGLSAAIQSAFQNYFLKWLKPKNKSMAHYVANFPWAK
ncbi:Transmembrane protein, partial [Pseudolycoriella hygida]